MKKSFFFLFVFFLSASTATFATDFSAELGKIKISPRSEVFFTQTENCYALQLPNIAPAKVRIDLPDLPLGTKCISSKKEETITENGKRATLITLWFTFDYSGETHIPPLLVHADGMPYYLEFQQTMVYENPALISPVLEVSFDTPKNSRFQKSDDKKVIKVQKGEEISFTLQVRYAIQILEYKWELPKDSLFEEKQRSDFARGKEKVTEFTTSAKKVASFSWKILKAGAYFLPPITIEALSFNGEKKRLSLPQDIIIIVLDEKYQALERKAPAQNQGLFSSSFAKPQETEEEEKNAKPDIEEFRNQAGNAKRTFLEKLTRKRPGIFTGGTISAIPEEKSSGQYFSGGQRIIISEEIGEWIFIECKDFSGWTKRNKVITIK